ncbi:hypothetical protein [Geoalkalibacter sp.]|uniref:hypothetical protein n=1 Tax=Geoalkalibacter sp. TaxID=3041440 RepID=UPI00272E95D6|nr:hypothetical protein [Geoalkalibacter sp.]
MIAEKIAYRPKWVISKFADDAAFAAGQAYARHEIDGNLLLNEGIALMLDLLIGAGGTALSNANARLAVGDSATAEGAAQTGLQAATNKLYKAVEAGYPQRSGQTVTWRAVFGASDANFAWQEFSVANGASDAAVNLNRKVSNQGTKASGQTWTLDLQITLS